MVRHVEMRPPGPWSPEDVRAAILGELERTDIRDCALAWVAERSGRRCCEVAGDPPPGFELRYWPCGVRCQPTGWMLDVVDETTWGEHSGSFSNLFRLAGDWFSSSDGRRDVLRVPDPGVFARRRENARFFGPRDERNRRRLALVDDPERLGRLVDLVRRSRENYARTRERLLREGGEPTLAEYDESISLQVAADALLWRALGGAREYLALRLCEHVPWTTEAERRYRLREERRNARK